MPREGAPAKARRYLAEGRLVITKVDGNRVSARCRGDGTVYRVTYQWNTWACTCAARSDCAHLLATRLVTAVDLQGAP